MGGKLPRDPSPGAEQGDLDSGKTLRSQGLHGQFLAAEGELLSGGTRRGKEAKGGDWKIAPFQNPEHLDPDGTGGAHDGEMLRGGVLGA